MSGLTSPLSAIPHLIELGWPFGDVPSIAAMGPVVVIGNFDGVHLGHRSVIGEALALARRLGRPCMALTFEPHPRSFFQPDRPVFRLTPPRQKAALLAQAGCATTLAVTFDADFAALGADEFVDALLVKACRAAGVVAGYDFHFGKGRAGTPQMLRERLSSHAIPVIIADPFRLEGEAVSSSAIRAALEKGDVAHAARLLGRDWSVVETVRHGDKRGRELGFPTANLHLPPECRLAHGIYAVRAAVAGVTHDAIASFGRRPTFDGGAPKLEVMLFDFAGDLYGREIEVSFVSWIRGEERFDSVEALVARMNRDCDAARALLEARP
jgi:riboflavin kinase/FMN adenylyltransferase